MRDPTMQSEAAEFRILLAVFGEVEDEINFRRTSPALERLGENIQCEAQRFRASIPQAVRKRPIFGDLAKYIGVLKAKFKPEMHDNQKYASLSIASSSLRSFSAQICLHLGKHPSTSDSRLRRSGKKRIGEPIASSARCF